MTSGERLKAAARLLERRQEISGELAALVEGWPKYADHFARDPAGFAEIESAALVDYMAAYLRDGDVAFRHLYVGEKAKQFYDPATPPEQRQERERKILAGERAAFLAALGDFGEARDATAEAFDAIDEALTGEAEHELRVLLIGDCLYLDVIAFLTAPAIADNIRLVPRFVTSHDLTEVQSELAALVDQRFDLIFFSPFTYAFLPNYEALQRPRLSLKPRAAARHADAAVSAAEVIFDTVADLFDCPIVAHLPAAILRHEGSLKERLVEWLTGPVRRRAVRRLRRSLEHRTGERNQRGQAIMLLDEQEIVGDAGLREAGRYYHHLFLQHPARFGALVADAYRDILFTAARLIKRKVVVCDLDDTLWKGTIGEGLGVIHHRDRQATLLELKQRGVVLAINSKNDPAKVAWEPVAGGLGLDHFVSRQISWDAKVVGMRRIAEHLNLKEKDFLFIDDRADERAMVAETYPKMIALDANDGRTWRALAFWAELLPAKPGADRTEFYRQRDEREAFISAKAETDAAERARMYGQLELKVTVREAGEADIARVADLINRTNQFNMAGSRVTRREVEQWVASADARVLIADAADRFGSMGTIAVLIAVRAAGRIEVPVFVLSCRVFGYGMEFAILAEALRLAEPDQAVFGQFSETEHNQPCREVYPAAGFSAAPGGWLLQVNEPISVPGWLAVEAEIKRFGR